MKLKNARRVLTGLTRFYFNEMNTFERRQALKRQIDRTIQQIDALLLVQYNAANQLDRHAKELETARRELILLDTPAVAVADPVKFYSIDHV